MLHSPAPRKTDIGRSSWQEGIVRDIVGDLDVTCFQTSIWDETLYRAWSQIVYSLIPNVSQLENKLSIFCNACGADEVVIFERATFLVIAHSTRKAYADVHRFEKVSQIRPRKDGNRGESVHNRHCRRYIALLWCPLDVLGLVHPMQSTPP